MKSLTSRVLAVLGTSGSGIMSEAFLLSTRLREDSSTASGGGDEEEAKNTPPIRATPGSSDDFGPAEAPPGVPLGPNKPGPPEAKPGPPGPNGPPGPTDPHTTPVLNPRHTEDDFYNDVKWQCMKTDKKGDSLPFGPGDTFQPLYYIEPFDHNSAAFKHLNGIRNRINKALGPGEIRPPQLILIDMIMSKEHGDQVWQFLESKMRSAEVAALKADARKIAFDPQIRPKLKQLIQPRSLEPAPSGSMNPKALVLEIRPSSGTQYAFANFRTRFYHLLEKSMEEHCPGKVNVCREKQWSTYRMFDQYFSHVVFACGDKDPWFAINDHWWPHDLLVRRDISNSMMYPHSTIVSDIGFWARAAQGNPGEDPVLTNAVGQFGSAAIKNVVARATADGGLDPKGLQELSDELWPNELSPLRGRAPALDPHGPGQIHHAEISRGHQPCRNLLPAEPETINLGKP
eukprot:g12940.t1